MDAVAADIADKYPGATVHNVSLDLSDLDSIKAAAAQIDGLVDHVDVLINNAGMNSLTRKPVQTPGDTIVDLAFSTNHLGPFLFTHLLTPKLRAAAGAGGKNTRIVNLSSHGHRLSPVRFYDYQISHYVYDGVPENQKPPRDLPEGFLKTAEDGYPGFIGYGQSKTANILHAIELTRRFRKDGQQNILALSLHPGAIRTELSRDMDKDGLETVEQAAAAYKWKSMDEGAATSIVAGFDPKLDETLGEAIEKGTAWGYMSDCQVADEMLAEWVKDRENAERLYVESERMLGVKTGL